MSHFLILSRCSAGLGTIATKRVGKPINLLFWWLEPTDSEQDKSKFRKCIYNTMLSSAESMSPAMRWSSPQPTVGIVCLFLISKLCLSSVTGDLVQLRPLRIDHNDRSSYLDSRSPHPFSKLDLQNQGHLAWWNTPGTYYHLLLCEEAEHTDIY